MIQINLIPDVKLEMLRSQQIRNVAVSIAVFAAIIAGGAVVALGLVYGGQIGLQAKYKADIKKEYSQLSQTKDINNALTVQGQLEKISDLNNDRSIDSRMLDVLTKVNPSSPDNVKIARVAIDPTTSTLTIEGSAAGGYPSTEVFRKTILHTNVTYQKENGGENQTDPLTTEVDLKDTSYGQDNTGAKVVRFTVSFKYLDHLFDNSLKNVVVAGPTGRTDVTDSATRVPDSMFSKAATDLREGQ